VCPIIKITGQRNAIGAGVFNMKFNTLLPLVYVRGLVMFHAALLF
jgi:hypothetical protein